MLAIHRSGYYYKTKQEVESELNLELMKLAHGSDQTALLGSSFQRSQAYACLVVNKDKAFHVSKHRIERLYYNVKGSRAVMPGKHTSSLKHIPIYFVT